MSLPNSISNTPSNIALIRLLAQATGIPIRAVLGDYTGRTRVGSRSGVTDDVMTKGLYYARIPNGYTAEGTSAPGDLIVVRGNGIVQAEYNMPVMVRAVPSSQGLYEIVSYDIQTLANQGKNVAQYAEPRAMLPDVWTRLIWDGRDGLTFIKRITCQCSNGSVCRRGRHNGRFITCPIRNIHTTPLNDSNSCVVLQINLNIISKRLS